MLALVMLPAAVISICVIPGDVTVKNTSVCFPPIDAEKIFDSFVARDKLLPIPLLLLLELLDDEEPQDELPETSVLKALLLSPSWSVIVFVPVKHELCFIVQENARVPPPKTVFVPVSLSPSVLVSPDGIVSA
jgi:hypothetical protein